MILGTHLLDNTWAYRLWQAPFAERKLAPILAHNDLRAVRRVLDVGCGPGTNTRHFEHAEYLGIDYNSRYIEWARRRHGRAFVVADVTSYNVPADQRFDFILANSLLHHVDTPAALRLLAHLADLLTVDGHIHVLDLVLPDAPSPARVLARWDRGGFPRPLAEWERIFTIHFDPVILESYAIATLGVPLWKMVYFKGRARK